MFCSQVQCLNCKKLFYKNNNQIKKSVNHFCTRSCSVKFNNAKTPKRKQEGFCKECGSTIRTSQTYCKHCKIKLKYDPTLFELQNTDSFKCNKFTCVRDRSRRIIHNLNIKSCCLCGYNKHIEVSHIKPIRDFDLSTKVSVVNHITNLAPLCPNCHWEFDHGLIDETFLRTKLTNQVGKPGIAPAGITL